MLMMTTTLHQPEPNGSASRAGPALTVSEATKALGGQVSRSTIERAINTRALPARKGRTPAGKPCVLVDRDDLVHWHARREGAAAGDDDDDVLTAHRAAADDDDAVPRPDAARLAPDVAQERLGELLRGVQAQGIAEVGRQVQPLVDRLVYAEARAARAEAERDVAILERNVERTRRYELEQRRSWWARWWTRLRGGS